MFNDNKVLCVSWECVMMRDSALGEQLKKLHFFILTHYP